MFELSVERRCDANGDGVANLDEIYWLEIFEWNSLSLVHTYVVRYISYD